MTIKNYYLLSLIGKLHDYLDHTKCFTQLCLIKHIIKEQFRKMKSKKKFFKYNIAILSTKSCFLVF